MDAPWNPVAAWSNACLWITIGALSAAVVGAMAAIVASDRPLREVGLPGSSALEWVRTPAEADALVLAYRDAERQDVVVRGVLIDSFGLVPAYSALLAIACFFAARALTPGWATWALVVGYGALVAGALDLVENAGILTEVLLQWSFVAPMTYLACLAKWTLVGLSALFALGTLISRPFVD